jgi:hypothetical protein
VGKAGDNQVRRRPLFISHRSRGGALEAQSSAPCARVVGVVQDVHRASLNEEPSLQVYVPFGQERGFAGARLLVRPVSNTTLSWPALRQAMLDADPAIRLVDLHELSESLGGEMQPLRLGMVTFGAGAVLALLASALGL